MTRPLTCFLGLGLLALTGCASQSQQLAAKAPTATETALVRARFDMNCPSVTGVVLSSDYIQPALNGPWMNAGVTRAEYTIGAEGCGKRATYIVMCQEGSNTCFAAQPQGTTQVQ
jgi:hypothetical protein